MMQPITFLSRLIVALMLGLACLPALAQTDDEENDRGLIFGTGVVRATAGPEIIDQQRLNIDEIIRETDRLERRMRANTEDDAVLVEVRNGLEEKARKLIEAGVAFRPRLTSINDRIEQIGPAQDGEPEGLANERQSLISEKAAINTLLGEAETLSLRVNRLIDEVAQTRRDLFTRTLSRRYDISTALSPEVFSDFAKENRKVYQVVTAWVRFVVNYKLSSVLMATLFALGAAAVLLVGGRRLFGRMIIVDPLAEHPSYISRLSVAFWSTLLNSATLAMFLAATYFFYNYYGVLRLDIAQMMQALFYVTTIVYFVYRLTKSIFAPSDPKWRLVPIETPAARVLFWLAWLTALVNGIDFLASRINDVMGSPLSLTIAKSLFSTIVVGILVLLICFVKPYRDEDGKPRSWNGLFRALLFVLGAGTIVAALLGYIGLARFISQQIVVTGAILATMYIGYLSASALSEEGALTHTSLGRRFDARFQLDNATEDQVSLAASIIINLLVLCIGIPLILLQWGFQWGDIQAWVYNVATEFRIGTISISLIGIFTGIGLFLVGYFGTRGFQRWLDGKVMARGRVDSGVRNSIKTAVGYAGIALAALFGVSAAGIDLSNLALVAGALSLGIGFGLQNIVNNFVSGLILLAERPFKVGDWIVAGGVEGTVRKISVRATEIETFRRQTVILPNKEFIDSAVGNWTHRNKLGRVDIPVTASYEADPRRVYELLHEIATAHPTTLKNPAPAIVFDGFGDSALNFVIRAFVADISATLAFTNEIRFQIVERFKAEGIDIPYPQRELHIKTGGAVGSEQPDEIFPGARIGDAEAGGRPSTPRIGRKGKRGTS